MIGVGVREEEREAVREFFELFKTPWEWLRPEREYDVVLLCEDRHPMQDAPLEIVYSSRRLVRDTGLPTRPLNAGKMQIRIGSKRLPIFGRLLALEGNGEPVATVDGTHTVVGVRWQEKGRTIVRLGYDLFPEIAVLLCSGQSVGHASIPTLDYHIASLRKWICESVQLLVEIPPNTGDSDFFCCLTHDVDFGGIRFHGASRSLGNFVYQSLFGSLHRVILRRASLLDLARNWLRVMSLPLIFLGLAKDFWLRFDTYAVLDGNHATFYVLPFKNRAGTEIPLEKAFAKRASRYDVFDVRSVVVSLARNGSEIGLHGIDAWHDPAKAEAEALRVKRALDLSGSLGVRIHWLLQDERTPHVLDRAGFDYDSSRGFNETVGYRAGTTLVFRPAGCQRMLELPVHIQDVGLLKNEASFERAHERCRKILDHVTEMGGVVTVLWHDGACARSSVGIASIMTSSKKYGHERAPFERRKALFGGFEREDRLASKSCSVTAWACGFA